MGCASLRRLGTVYCSSVRQPRSDASWVVVTDDRSDASWVLVADDAQEPNDEGSQPTTISTAKLTTPIKEEASLECMVCLGRLATTQRYVVYWLVKLEVQRQ